MTHPLVSRLVPLMDHRVEELHAIVAEWVVGADTELERARFRAFGSELGKVQARIGARPVPPTSEELEIALTALLAVAGWRVGWPRA